MAHIESLPWDSNFFELRIGRVIVDDESKFDAISFREEAEASFDLVYVFCYGKLLTNQGLVSGNLVHKDIMLTMSMPFLKDNYKSETYDFRTSLAGQELRDCYRIAEQTSVVSRFYHEPSIGKDKTNALYRRWIDGALDKSYSDGLFLQKESNDVIGIHIIKTDPDSRIGHFTLTGVNPDLKRMGIGKKLWLQSFAYWAHEHEIDIIKSPFSIQNIDSLNFHLKMGFNRVDEIKYIYHWTRNKINK